MLPLVNKMERRLTATSRFLNYAGRIELVNTSMTSLLTYLMCTIKIPLGAVDNMDRARRN